MEKQSIQRQPNPRVFLKILKREFLNRKEGNPAYSLRAFARSLNVDPGLLSKILNDQRRPSVGFMQSCLDKLRMDLEEELVLFQGNGDLGANHRTLDHQGLKPISKWYFFAILDLFHLEDFENDEVWMANRVGIDVKTLRLALEILEESNHITVGEDGQYLLNTKSSNWVDFNSTSVVRRSLQKQILKQAEKAIDEVDFRLRESSSLSLPIPLEMIPEVKVMIDDFKRKVADLADQYDHADEVYQLAIHFFPLTNVNEKLESKENEQ